MYVRTWGVGIHEVLVVEQLLLPQPRTPGRLQEEVIPVGLHVGGGLLDDDIAHGDGEGGKGGQRDGRDGGHGVSATFSTCRPLGGGGGVLTRLPGVFSDPRSPRNG